MIVRCTIIIIVQHQYHIEHAPSTLFYSSPPFGRLAFITSILLSNINSNTTGLDSARPHSSTNHNIIDALLVVGGWWRRRMIRIQQYNNTIHYRTTPPPTPTMTDTAVGVGGGGEGTIIRQSTNTILHQHQTPTAVSDGGGGCNATTAAVMMPSAVEASRW